jgi:hypothetical protein
MRHHFAASVRTAQADGHIRADIEIDTDTDLAAVDSRRRRRVTGNTGDEDKGGAHERNDSD